MRPARWWAGLFLVAAELSPGARVRALAASAQTAGSRPPVMAADAQSSTPEVQIGDAERSALTFTSYDLELHLRPSDASLSVLARVTVRNDGTKPLPKLALQVSSALHWEGVTLQHDGRSEKLAFQQHLLETDADDTGKTSEVVISLRGALAVHGTAEFALLYSGQVQRPSAGNAESSSSGESQTSWGVISPEGTYLRGFGDVLWYPVSSPQVFLGEGASLLQATGQQMLRGAAAKVRLRVSIDYTGESPEAVFFCGREERATSLRDNPDAPVADSPGVATADFPAQELGFRLPSLLITEAPVPVVGTPLALVSTQSGFAERLAVASTPVTSLLQDWFGVGAGRTLTVIDHAGPTLVDAGLLVTPLSNVEGPALAAGLVAAMERTRFRSVQPWLDRGMAQLFSWLWLERTQGRPAAVAALTDASHVLALAEAAGTPGVHGQGLLDTDEEVYYRTKAAAVLWMLRDMVGDAVLKQALQRYLRDPRADRDRLGFERVLEGASEKDLKWFFDDWVYHDRGLPELSIVSASSHLLASQTVGEGGRLVAVEVRNDGGASVEVSVTARSGMLTATERLRINAHSVASVRILFQGTPEEVQVNDGTIPEMIENTHVQRLSAD